MHVNAKVPGFIRVVVRTGETSIRFRPHRRQANKQPTGDTMFRIGSISKAFCGEVLASMVVDGTVRFADRLQDRLGYEVTLPEHGGRPIRLIDLVTQASGLPHEVPRLDAPPDDPFSTNTKDAQIADLKTHALLFSHGTARLYGFDLLGAALANAGGKPYAGFSRSGFSIPLVWKICRATTFTVRRWSSRTPQPASNALAACTRTALKFATLSDATPLPTATPLSLTGMLSNRKAVPPNAAYSGSELAALNC